MNNFSFRKSLVLSIAVLTAVLVLFGFYIAQHQEQFNRILDLSIVQYSVLSALVILGVLNNGLMLFQYLKSVGISLHAKEYLSLSALTTAGNQLLFRGGALAKAFYLKRRHAFALSRFLPIMGAQFIITLFAVGLMGLAGVGWLALKGQRVDAVPGLVFAAVILGPTLILKITPAKLPDWLGRNKYIAMMFDSWQKLCANKAILKILIALSIINVLLYIGRLYAAFHYTGTDIAFVNIYLISLLGILTELIGVVPGGLGIKEVVVGFSTELYGGEIKEGVVAASLDRAVLIGWVFLLGIAALVYLMGSSREQKEGPQR